MNTIPIAVLLCLGLLSNGDLLARPNILLINVDDLGYGDLGSFGHPVIETPNIDRLAQGGMKLTNYYAPSALCSPSRAGLLTGRIPYRTGIRSWIPAQSNVYLRDAELTLAEVLKEAGYRTAIIGKWHLNSDLGSSSEPQPNDQGFDHAYGHNAFQIPTNRDPVNVYRNGRLLEKQRGYTADLYADEAIRWLGQDSGDAPFFLYLAMAEPHTTFENPDAYNEKYAAFTAGEIVPIPSGLDRVPTELLVARGPGEYFANVTYMDAQLGRVFRALNELGQMNDTLIVFVSDNGPVTSRWIQWHEVNAHGDTGGLRGRKHFLYEGGIRVPAIAHYPGVIDAGTVSAELVTGMDLFVTLAEFGDGNVPDDRPIDGINVAAVFAGGKLPQRTLFWALDSVSDLEYAVRKGNWKLMLDKHRQPQELYDLAKDPLEFFNRIDSHADIVRQLRAEFDEYAVSIDNDPLRPGA